MVMLMLSCPVCGKKRIWRYGLRSSRKGQMRRLLCKDCGHLWEVLEEATQQNNLIYNPNVAPLPSDLKDYFVELMGHTVEDVEKGIDPEKAGWCVFSPEISKRLVQTGFCEMSSDGIRLLLSKPLPRDLAWTDIGDMILDVQKAIELTESLSELSENEDLRRGAEYAGLVRMLQTSDFPVLAYVLFEESLNPDIWFLKAPESAYELTLALSGKLWGLDMTAKALTALDKAGFPTPEKKQSVILEKVKKVLRWDIVLEVFQPEILEALGFAWYADLLCVSKKIKYQEGLQIVQDKISDILEMMTGRTFGDLADELLSATEEMENRVMKQCERGKSQVTDWHDIIRFPG